MVPRKTGRDSVDNDAYCDAKTKLELMADDDDDDGTIAMMLWCIVI